MLSGWGAPIGKSKTITLPTKTNGIKKSPKKSISAEEIIEEKVILSDSDKDSKQKS